MTIIMLGVENFLSIWEPTYRGLTWTMSNGAFSATTLAFLISVSSFVALVSLFNEKAKEYVAMFYNSIPVGMGLFFGGYLSITLLASIFSQSNQTSWWSFILILISTPILLAAVEYAKEMYLGSREGASKNLEQNSNRREEIALEDKPNGNPAGKSKTEINDERNNIITSQKESSFGYNLITAFVLTLLGIIIVPVAHLEAMKQAEQMCEARPG